MTTDVSALVLGTTARPVHPGCSTPGAPRTSWHRDGHRVLVEVICPDCSARFTVEVDREHIDPEPPAAPEAPEWTSLGSQRLVDLDGLPSAAAKFAKAATKGGWTVRAYYAWGVEKGEHPYESVGLSASHDDPRVVVVRAWLRRTSTATASWSADGAYLTWPHRQDLTDAEASAVVQCPTLGLRTVAAATQPTKRGFTDAQKAASAPKRARTASAKQREAASGG